MTFGAPDLCGLQNLYLPLRNDVISSCLRISNVQISLLRFSMNSLRSSMWYVDTDLWFDIVRLIIVSVASIFLCSMSDAFRVINYF